MVSNNLTPGFRITTNQDEFDLYSVLSFLESSYWAKGITLERLSKAVENSLCFGVISPQGRQVGFARVISDKSTFAYLSDVYILQEYRGFGLSKLLLMNIFRHKDLQGLRRFMLSTLDAQGLYSKFGFTDLKEPKIHMEKSLLELEILNANESCSADL
ncbi:GNAT family N-acetyltransferase [Aliiglaciecola sp. M165]|uniref:GNAT family N-acetyltransferase n=1 Tax=Aliiglaciecola sp. M165 TaxID=2593649 RepID=UPI00117DF4CD|nr:GNAT family N-acetyltransferase [Aliiglaciecola sp. M165]TRY33872.1 GNAT family N-acetyltransferase [Aliiglaciecola sp. M165]